MALSLAPAIACAQEIKTDGDSASPATSLSLDAAQLFEFAEESRAAGDFETAEKAYRALAQDPSVELRNEARFRLAMMLADQLGNHREAAVLLRQILDEQPDVARVRVELARMQAMMGNLTEAAKELRAAQAAGLPPEVEKLVRFYASALASKKPFGASMELALAPDSNINRATRSDTLETVIGDFTLDENAQERSGVGLRLRGQAYVRQGLTKSVDLLARVNASGNFYRESDFDDYVVSLQAGPQFTSGSDRLSLSGTTAWRWFGRSPYSFSYGVTGDYRHPTGKRSQLRLDAGVIHTTDRLNRLRTTDRYSLAAGVDRAFSARFGGGLRVSGYRAVANDPGYSTTGGGIEAFLFREAGQTTLVASAGYDRLEADKRLFLYPERRVDDRFSTSLTGTFRSLRVLSFAPLVRVSYENNSSTVGIYDFERIAAEFGVTAAF